MMGDAPRTARSRRDPWGTIHEVANVTGRGNAAIERTPTAHTPGKPGGACAAGDASGGGWGVGEAGVGIATTRRKGLIVDINQKQDGSFGVPTTGVGSFPMAQPVTNGNSIFVQIWGAKQKPVVTDSLRNVYVQIGGDTLISPPLAVNTSYVTSLFWCPSSNPGANTLTVNAPGANVVYREVNSPGFSPNDVPTLTSLVQRLATAFRA